MSVPIMNQAQRDRRSAKYQAGKGLGKINEVDLVQEFINTDVMPKRDSSKQRKKPKAPIMKNPRGMTQGQKSNMRNGGL